MQTPLNINKIKQNLPASENLIIEIFNSIPSTNDYLKNKSDADPAKIYVCLAEEQTRGRGRFERKWYSPAYANIYLSILIHSDKKLHELTGLSVAVGKAVLTALEQYGINPGLSLKHPNDIFYGQQKLAGILIETFNAKNKLAVVIGIGLNVNMQTGTIDQAWTSLAKITQTEHDRNVIVGLLVDGILQNILNSLVG